MSYIKSATAFKGTYRAVLSRKGVVISQESGQGQVASARALKRRTPTASVLA